MLIGDGLLGAMLRRVVGRVGEKLLLSELPRERPRTGEGLRDGFFVSQKKSCDKDTKS